MYPAIFLFQAAQQMVLLARLWRLRRERGAVATSGPVR